MQRYATLYGSLYGCRVMQCRSVCIVIMLYCGLYRYSVTQGYFDVSIHIMLCGYNDIEGSL